MSFHQPSVSARRIVELEPGAVAPIFVKEAAAQPEPRLVLPLPGEARRQQAMARTGPVVGQAPSLRRQQIVATGIEIFGPDRRG